MVPQPVLPSGYPTNASLNGLPPMPPADYRSQYGAKPMQDTAPAEKPKYDAGMSQLAHMIQAQEKENAELKTALQQFGKDAGQVQALEQTIQEANKDLLGMKNDLGYTIETAVGVAAVNGHPIPEMYAFRQNELRVEDLGAEEKALMNLQA
jgi:exonuclease VII small subunit